MKLTPSKTAVRRLALARAISFTGGEAAIIALAYTLYQRTGSSLWLSAAFILTFGTIGVMSAVTGSLGDRYDRRRVMIVSDVAGAACFVVLALAHAPAALLAIAFLASAAESPFIAASGAAIPNLVEKEDLAWANSLISIGQNGGLLMGPALGGLLLAAIGASAVFVLNGASFLVSAALVWSVRANFADRQREGHHHRGLHAGFVFLWRDPVLRTIAAAWIVLLLGIGLVFVAEVTLALSFDVGSVGYGLIATCFGGGAIVGALVGRFLASRHERAALVGGALSIAFGLAVVVVTPWFALVLVGMLAGGLGEGFAEVAEQGVYQRHTPDAVRSRVMGAAESIALSSIAASLLFAGFVVDAVGPRASYALAAAASVVAAGVLAWGLRRASRPVPEGGGGSAGAAIPQAEPARARAEEAARD